MIQEGDQRTRIVQIHKIPDKYIEQKQTGKHGGFTFYKKGIRVVVAQGDPSDYVNIQETDKAIAEQLESALAEGRDYQILEECTGVKGDVSYWKLLSYKKPPEAQKEVEPAYMNPKELGKPIPTESQRPKAKPFNGEGATIGMIYNNSIKLELIEMKEREHPGFDEQQVERNCIRLAKLLKRAEPKILEVLRE